MGCVDRETRCCFFRWDERGFIHATVREGLEMTGADAVEALRAIREMGGGERRPVLVDGRGIKYQTREAREYLSGPEADRVSSAVAFITGSPVSRLIGNFFLRQNKPSSPMRLFTDLPTATLWILHYLQGQREQEGLAAH